MKPLCINYIDDNRYGNIYTNMYSHNELHIECIKVKNLADVDINLILQSKVILINEGQFFSDLIQYCKLWCNEYQKDIVVCGLDGDYQQNPFGQILNLIPYANSVVKLNAFCQICLDGTKAYFTHRVSNETDQIVIGVNNYQAVCRECMLKLKK